MVRIFDVQKIAYLKCHLSVETLRNVSTMGTSNEIVVTGLNGFGLAGVLVLHSLNQQQFLRGFKSNST